jgi:hypothetical protein
MDSLLPDIRYALRGAMIAHALIDVGSGTVGYLLLRDESSPDAPAAIAQTATCAPRADSLGQACAANNYLRARESQVFSERELRDCYGLPITEQR